MGEIKEFCDLCGRSSTDVGDLIPVTGGIKVCRHCMSNAMNLAQQLTAFTRNSDNIEPFGAGTSAANVPSDKTEADDKTSKEGTVLSETGDEPQGPGSEPAADDPEKDPDKVRFAGGFGLPNVGFLNMADLQKMMFGTPAEKKKKERQRLERQERRRKNKEKYDAIRARVKAVKRAQKEMKKASKENSEAVIEDPVIQESSDTAVNSPDVEEVTTPNE